MSESNVFTYTLYSTLGCHLCDVAVALIAEHFPDKIELIALCDIAQEDELIERLGERIPVLEHNPSAKTLDWPFTPQDLTPFFTPPT